MKSNNGNWGTDYWIDIQRWSWDRFNILEERALEGWRFQTATAPYFVLLMDNFHGYFG
jgi:hypothetical protein